MATKGSTWRRPYGRDGRVSFRNAGVVRVLAAPASSRKVRAKRCPRLPMRTATHWGNTNMAASNLPALFTVSQRRKKSARKSAPAVVQLQPPSMDLIDEEVATTAIQRLCEASRGVALVLESLSEEDVLRDVYVLGGLARALKIAVDSVSCEYFRSAGDLASTLDPELLTALLQHHINGLKGRPK